MATYQLYIGSNNDTHKIELDKIESICGMSHDGFTVYKAVGYWKGTKEQSAVVLVTDDDDRVKKTIYRLKKELRQDAIGYQTLPDLEFA